MNGGSAPTILIFGGGGHARVLIDILHARGITSLGIVEADLDRHGGRFAEVPIVGGDDAVPTLIAAGSAYFAIGVGGPISGDTRPRRVLFERALALGLSPLAIVHPDACVSSSASLGAGIQVMPGAIVNAGSSTGINVIINSGAIVEHDCRIGDHAHVATRATLCGGVVVGAGAHIGAGAVVRQGTTIGSGAVVALGAVVVADVPPETVVAGVPARVLRARVEATPTCR